MIIDNKIKKVEKALYELKKYALSGDILEHKALAKIKTSNIKENLECILSEIQDKSLTSILNLLEQGKKTLKDEEYSYTVKNGSTRYYYTNIKEVIEAKKELEKSEAYKKLKETESKYKTAFLLGLKNKTILDEETGELVDPKNIKIVYTKDSIIIKERINE